MTRASESGGFGGAISSMVAQMDICPSCGSPISEHRQRLLTAGGCSNVVFGAFPILSEGFAPSQLRVELWEAPASDANWPEAEDAKPEALTAGNRPANRNRQSADLLLRTLELPFGSENFS
jgi:hypothetical protein